DAVFVYLERMLASDHSMQADLAPRPYGLVSCAVSPDGHVVAAVAPREAVWLGFQAVDPGSPAVVRVRAESSDGIDAITGQRWEDGLRDHPRNHLVCPPDSRLVGDRDRGGIVPFALDGAHGTRHVVRSF